jgi:hypothetical protein
MRRIAGLLVLTVTAVLLSGCVYDPYTGTYAPCCGYYGSYGYYGYYRSPYYRYPPSYAPYGYPSGPYMTAPQGQPGAYPQGPGQPPPRPGAAASPGGGGALAQRFAMANVPYDGHLTRDEAAAGMPLVARNFDAIDAGRKGHVTLPEVRAFAAERRAELRQQGQPGAP